MPKANKKLFEAIDAGDVASVRSVILSQSPDIINANHLSDTALHHAASHEPGEQVQCLSVLLEGTAIDRNVANEAGRTALHCAAIGGRAQAVKVLIRAGARLDLFERTGQTALHCAADQGWAPCLEAAVGCGATVDAKNAKGETALFVAVARGHVECVEALLEATRPGVDIPSEAGQAPLHRAAEDGEVAIAEALVRAGASRELRNASGQTAMDVAGAAGHAPLALKLKPREIVVEAAPPVEEPTAPVPEGLLDVTDRERATLQALVASTSGGKKLELLQVLRNTNLRLSDTYKEKIEDLTLSYVKKISDFRTSPGAPSLNLEPPLSAGVNECLLFHGLLSPDDAAQVCSEGFSTMRDGAYGRGLLFAEGAQQADAEAMEGCEGANKGLRAMVVCRVIVGMPTSGEDGRPLDEIRDAVNSESCHSILGGLAPSRTFTLLNPEQAIPAFLIVYRAAS